jgi:hypothetical protein
MICGIKFNNIELLNQHNLGYQPIQNSDKIWFPCKLCNGERSFYDERGLNQHMIFCKK